MKRIKNIIKRKLEDLTEESINVINNPDVHTEHCCVNHGCKYNDIDCSVITLQKKQSFGCLYTSVCYELNFSDFDL